MDSRIRYTKFRIRVAFFELLKNCPVDKMTVKGLCDIAMVNRATFKPNLIILANKTIKTTAAIIPIIPIPII